jgi:glycogen debranching enzyme
MSFCFSIKRTRISYLAEQARTKDAALRKESRTRFINATTLNRKSGERSGVNCCSALTRKMKAMRAIGLVLLLLTCLAPAELSFDTRAPDRFIAVHGRKAIVMGYASSGLELWAYPLQLISGYEPGFRVEGETTEINAATLLRRITYEPQAITRTYIGPDFVVREKLFVPLDEAAVLITYSVDGPRTVDVVIHFTPVLDLMWPASIGGQNTHWDPAASAYILADAMRKYSAMIGSPDVVSHDRVLNNAQPATRGNQLAFTVHASPSHSATVIVARNDQLPPIDQMKNLLAQEPTFEAEARDHYSQLLATTLRIETPDEAINRQLAWAQIALDQAWVCNPVLGCGLVAGYGPSRDARRPQYAWFFAGDGLIATEALVNSGDYPRAQEALAFIAKYQDARTGMIWHELSQSADPADWATKYPYMFVHVDITFDYLITVEHYINATGDTQWLQQNWPGLEAAYRYCESLLDREDGLPRIPATKEGGNEQDRLTDDLSLATSWVRASAAFARLATLSSHASMAEEAMQRSDKAKNAAAHRYWDSQRKSWIDGYDGLGHPVTRHSVHGVDLVAADIVDLNQTASILDQLSSSGFQTDWGTRGVDANSTRFDPASYASGSVSPLSTARVAAAFWSQHRPYSAFSIWNALIPWGTLDSMGHMHEVLAGNFYHPQAESVPEQTWSSAAFLSSAVTGLLGLEREAHSNRLQFSPHLPPAWPRLSIKNIQVPGGKVNLTLSQTPEGLNLETENSGSPVELLFSPQIPFGAHLTGAELNGKPLAAKREEHPQDTHAAVTFTLPKGKSHCLVRYEGGVSLSVKADPPLIGESSKAIKITSVDYQANRLLLGLDAARDPSRSSIELRTNEKPLQAHGAKLESPSPGVYNLEPDPVSAPAGEYRHIEITVDLARADPK